MATYSSGGAAIKESSALKRTTDGSSSKTLGANEYALVSIYNSNQGFTSVNTTDGGVFNAGTVTNVPAMGLASGQFLVGGGQTFKVTGTTQSLSGSGEHTYEFYVDDIPIYTVSELTTYQYGTHGFSVQYVIFE